jgi:hypothetical protein
MEPVDFEYGLSSMGVTDMREEGESKDWERWMRILGEGVRGGAAWRAAIVMGGDGRDRSYRYMCRKLDRGKVSRGE